MSWRRATATTVEMVNHRLFTQAAKAVRTAVLEALPHEIRVFFTLDPDAPFNLKDIFLLNSCRNMLISFFATSDFAHLVADRNWNVGFFNARLPATTRRQPPKRMRAPLTRSRGHSEDYFRFWR